MNTVMWYVVDLSAGPRWTAERRSDEATARRLAESWAKEGVECALTRLVARYSPSCTVDEVRT